MIDKNDFPDLPSTAQQIFDAFLADEAPCESIEQLATSAWELMLQVWRDIHQAPINEEHPQIDRRLTQLIEQWDSDDPNLAIIEKIINRNDLIEDLRYWVNDRKNLLLLSEWQLKSNISILEKIEKELK